MITKIFTYGSYGMDYIGGWTEVTAPTAKDCYKAFRFFHPDKYEGIVHCADIYSIEEFSNTKMSKKNSNLGHGCHERITFSGDSLNREVLA